MTTIIRNQPTLATTPQAPASPKGTAEMCLLMKIASVVFKILLPLALIGLAYALLPITFTAVHLPFISAIIGLSYAVSFSTTATPKPVEPLPPEAPRGILNRGANCWVNSLTQVIRTDAGMVNWIENSPDAFQSEGRPYMQGPLALASVMPRDILFEPEELAEAPLESTPLISLFRVTNLPEGFVARTPQQKLIYRNAEDNRLMEFIYKTEEIRNVLIDGIFSDQPAADLLIDIESLPGNEQERRHNNAISLVGKIRQFAAAQQLTDGQKATLVDRIDQYNQICNYLVEPEILASIGQEMEVVPDHIADFRALVATCPYFKLMASTAKFVSEMSEDDRSKTLKYFSVIQSSESSKRVASVKFLANFKQFFNDYNEAMAHGATHTVSPSQELRRVFSENSELLQIGNQQVPTISLRIDQQFDPYEAIRYVEHIFPTGLKGQLHQDMGNVPHQGSMFLHLIEGHPNPSLQTMLNGHAEVFAAAPPSLWPAINRLQQVQPWSFLHAIFPCCFAKPNRVNVKATTPVVMEDYITLNTIEEGPVLYKLDSFIVHQGHTLNFGHYLSYKLVQNALGQEVWYEINDSQVRLIEGEELLKARGQVYLPHYSRV
jgi:hypothetical protein